jgi:8-oxo-dGTP pyrophosphatase MutT (NUDIX family)
MNLFEQITKYNPYNDQEKKDKEIFLRYFQMFPDILNRSNELVHVSASGWIVNHSRTKVLLVYHNIYDSWSWTGGHADGESNLLNVAIREAKEETGLTIVKPIIEDIFSLENLYVIGHFKNSKYISPHLHLNFTFLLEADDNAHIQANLLENKDTRWFTLKDALEVPSEKWMVENIYKKLSSKLLTI